MILMMTYHIALPIVLVWALQIYGLVCRHKRKRKKYQKSKKIYM